MTIDRKSFFDSTRDSLFNGEFQQGQVDGCNMILDTLDKRFPAADLRWIAYSLATAYHETARTMQPVREVGGGAGRAYGAPAGPFHEVYSGRGYIQLTWYSNYVKIDKNLHNLGILPDYQSLAQTPDLALHSDISADILVYGMAGGWFTGKKLGDYFTPTLVDWFNARRIVNGIDTAASIEDFGKSFFEALMLPADRMV